MIRKIGGLLLFVCVACSSDPATTDVAATNASIAMPALRELPLAVDSSLTIFDPPMLLAVSPKGEIVFSREYVADPNLVTIDSTGRRLASFGRLGDGPGELQVGGSLFSTDAAVMLIDPDGRRAAAFGFDGTPLWDMRNFESYWPIAVHDKVLLVNRDVVNHDGSYIESVGLPGRSSHLLIAATDSALRRLGMSASGGWPAAAWDGTRLVIGEGNSYTLASYKPGEEAVLFGRTVGIRHRTSRELAEATSDLIRRSKLPFIGPDGKVVPIPGPEARIKKLQFDTLPHFYWSGLAFDNSGRLWVVGQANDSTFADVYSDTTFVGRLMIDCYDSRWFRPVALRGHWLALACQSEDEQYHLRLFRIEE